MALKLNPVNSQLTPKQQQDFAINVLKANNQGWSMYTPEQQKINANAVTAKNRILGSANTSVGGVADPTNQTIPGNNDTNNTTNTFVPGGTVDPEVAKANSIKGDVRGKASQLLALYDQLFGSLDATVGAQAKDLEGQYGEQFKKTADQYAAAIPMIRNSYASVGADNSTDVTSANRTANAGFEETNKTIGKNKEADLTKLAKTKAEKKATYQAGKDSVNSNVSRLDSTTDVNALESMRSELDKGVSDANIEGSRLGTDGSFRDALRASTPDSGRFDQARTALDGIINSSMSGGEKQAAAVSIANNTGLTAEEKQKLNLQLGNVFNEQNVA